MRAIVVAAGYGSRMYPLAQDMPKCLLTIKKETFLGRQLRILWECDVKDVTIVTGFQYEKIVSLYGNQVSTCFNPHYEITGSIFSLWTAREVLTSDVVIMNSDVIFTKELLNNLLADSNPYCLVIDNKPCSQEAQKVKVEDSNIITISRMIPREETYGEYAGIAKVKREGIEPLKECLFECAKENSKSDWPIVFDRLARRGYSVNYILVNGLWIGVNTKEDYAKAQKMFGED